MIHSPVMLRDLSQGVSGSIVLIAPFLAFLAFSALTQWRMGVHPTASQTATPPELCTSGMFAYTRNPVYLAFILPLAALGYWSILAAVASIAMYMVATTLLVIRGEESFLASKFGPAYAAYCDRTPRWLLV
jgi:protein-S-isoprenylcysteine O-methyltransferase Ste14